MLSVRNVILVALAIFVLSLAINVASLLGPPDSNGAGGDSYGTKREGYRAVFDLLKAFDVPVERRIEPPLPELPTSSTIVVWQPDRDLIANEPAYLENLLAWIDKGGRIVVATSPEQHDFSESVISSLNPQEPKDVLTILKREGVRTISVTPDPTRKEKSPSTSAVDPREARREQIRKSLEKSFSNAPTELTTATAFVSGSFGKSYNRIRKLQVPVEKTGGLEIKFEDAITGKIECKVGDNNPWTIAAAFQHGKGEIVVVADPMLLMNASIAQSDNSTFAYDILAQGGRKVIFDEFYHGLSIRGNPLWLLTKSTYLLAFVMVLLLTCLVLWRSAILLGPPLQSQYQTRRTIVEYIDAMARFLSRARRSRHFLLGEIRSGTIRAMCERLHLAQLTLDPEVLAARLAKRSVPEAEQFRQAIKSLDDLLSSDRSISESEAVRVLQRISHCL